MRTWTRVLAVLLAVCMMGTTLPSTVLASKTAEGTEQSGNLDLEKPEESEAGASEESETGEPQESEKPEESDSELPEESKTETPEELETGAPQDSEAEKPEEPKEDGAQDQDVKNSADVKDDQPEETDNKNLDHPKDQEEPKETLEGEAENSLMGPAEDGASRSVIEEYTTLTVGQELHQTDGERQEYVFSPEESGYYRLSCNSIRGERFYLRADRTIYYTKDQQGNLTEHETGGYSEVSGTEVERLMWLNQEERYVFSCRAQDYDEIQKCDFVLKIDQVEIAGLEAAKNPTEDSYNYVNCQGMQVKINYKDGSSTVSEVRDGGSSYCYITALEWSEIAYDREVNMYSHASFVSIDGVQNSSGNCSNLSNGTHQAVMEVQGTENYQFEFEFTINRGNVASITVEDPQTEYTQDFKERLSNSHFQLHVTYNDGTAEQTISSSSSGVSQYLKYTVETTEGSREEYTESIDTYLKNGGRTGKATVYVSYRGVETTYQITIAENPYERMEVIPKRTVYYANCVYTFGDENYSGDRIDEYDFKIILYRKDGTQNTYDNWYELPERWDRGSFGIVEKDTGYANETNIDNYLARGGSLGEQQVRISYCGMEIVYPVTLKENPYDHIKIAESPAKKQYIHNQYASLELAGMVIYAYRDAEETESNYDIYRYDDYQNYYNGNSDLTEEQYYMMRTLFSAELGGHEYIKYLDLGSHSVNVFFMGRQAEFRIEVVEKLAAQFTITQTPEKLTYYANSQSEIRLYGLEFEVEDLTGTVKKYKYEECENPSYEDWREIERNFTSSNNINWKKPGRYLVTLSCLGIEKSFEVTLLADPVKSFQITKMPNQNSCYQYESNYFDERLAGIKYQITFQDGTTYSSDVSEWGNADFFYKGESFQLSVRWKVTSDGRPKIGQNALIVSAFGAQAETDPITIKEDPVKSLKVIKNPVKMQYIGRNEPCDLYGMELLITYIDGSSETVKVTEHGSNIEVDNQYGGAITSYISNGSNEKYLYISYRNQQISITLPPLDLAALDPIELSDESFCHTVLTKEKPYCVYSFTPTETKTYYFLSPSYLSAVTLYEGNRGLASSSYGDNTVNTKLTAGITYYYVVSHYNFGETGEFDCYLSSTVDSLSKLTVTDLEVIKPRKQEWYDFESDQIWSGDLLNQTVYEITYSNGWKQTEKIDGDSTEIGGKILSVKWKYTYQEEGDEWVEKRDDNAIVYTYGDKIMEFPVRFDLPSPVASLTIISNPWENQKIYEYNAYDYNSEGLSVNIHYNDGREDETVTWEYDTSSYDHNGYSMSLNWKDNDIRPGEKNTMVLSYMGKTAEIPLMIWKNPVESMEILELPQKTSYYPFEDIDLYGLEVRITYDDGSTQTVKAETHSGYVKVPGEYGQNIFASIRNEYGQEDKYQRICYISYMGYTEDLFSYGDREFKLEDSLSMAEDLEEKISLGRDHGYQIFNFVPSQTADYRFSYRSESGYGENYITIYNEEGVSCGENWGGSECSLECSLNGGEWYYIVVRVDYLEEREEELICSITRMSQGEKESIKTVDLSLNNPSAGQELVDFRGLKLDQSYILSCDWLNDDKGDGVADYGTAYRVKLVLSSYSDYQFTSSTQVKVNGKKVTSKSVSSDGKLTLYYTFPHTKCQVIVPQINGYQMDQSQNAEPGVCNYGESYKFRYLKEAGNNNKDKLIVKASDTVLVPDAEGYYVIEKVTENITVVTKTAALTAGTDETKLTLYNQSKDIFDILIGKQNAKIADNKGSETALPSLKSYTGGSDQFFFGWYQDKDDKLNGKGTRFTSQSLLKNPAYDLYAKWGSGLFTYVLNNKRVNCKLLSIDEYNRTKVQVGDSAGWAAQALDNNQAVKASGREIMQNLHAASEGSTLVIPETMDLSQNPDLMALGVNFADCQVTAIAANAFAGQEGIRSVSLPKTIESIGSGAFANCVGLEEIEIPDGVSEIGESAFRGCESLKTVTIPSSVNVVSEGAFQGCTNLTNVHLQEGVSEISPNAFEGCTNLTTLTIPDTMETIDTSSFTAGQDLTIICSKEMKESETVKSVQEATGAKVVAVDVVLNYRYDEKEFVLGDEAQRFTASVWVDGKIAKEREVVWTYTDTTAYEFAVSQNKRSLTVTPKRATTEDERIVITATDKETGRSISVVLKTPAEETKREQHITAFDVTKRKGDAPFMLKASTNGDGKLTFWSADPKVAKIDSKGEVTLTGLGTTKITIRASETEKYNAAEKKIRLTVLEKNKKIQSISASNIVKTYGDGDFKVGAATKGDGKLSYNCGNPKVVKVNGKTGKVKIVGAGTAYIVITASETNTYTEGTKKIKVSIKKADAKLKVNKKSYKKVYGNRAFKLKVSAKDKVSYRSSNQKVAAVKNGKITLKSCGKTTITVSVGSTNYRKASKKITIQVVPKKASVKKAASKKAGQITVTWKRQKEAAGYIVEYSTSKNFKKNVKKVEMKNNKTTSTTVKKISKGKKYYVRVKAYTKIGKKKVCGIQSKTLSVKVKKK